jgi:hypothetical protein
MFTTQTNEMKSIAGGECERHLVAFNANDATVEVVTNLKAIDGFAFGHCGTPGATELLSIDETVQDYGQIAVSGGSVTVRRAATTTSGLIVSLILFGK